MRIIFKIVSVLSITTLPVSGELFAQFGSLMDSHTVFRAAEIGVDLKQPKAEDGLIRLGYCNDGFSNNMILMNDGVVEYGAALYLSPSLLGKYVGDTINRVDFQISKKRGHLMSVFVTEDLNGKPLSSQSSASYDAGWNSVQLKRGVEIKEGQGLYVGYSIYLDGTEDADFVAFDSDYNFQEANVAKYKHDDRWLSVSPEIRYNVSIRAFASGSNFKETDLGVNKFLMDNYIEQNKNMEATVSVRNFGKEAIKSFDMEIAMNGEVVYSTSVTGLDIPHNERKSIDVDGVALPKEGNKTLDLRITNINGQDDADVSDNEKSRLAYVYKEGTTTETKNVLFESFVSEHIASCVQADSIYQLSVDKREDVIWVKHHIGNRDDQFTQDWEKEYVAFFSDGKDFVPAVMFDRQRFGGMEEAGPAYFVSSGMEVDGKLASCAAVPTFMRVEPKVTVSNDKKSLSVEVKAVAGTNEMPLQNQLRLTTYLVEDSIRSTEQKGVDVYFQNGVIRALLSENCWGDVLDISSYEDSKQYTVDLSGEWDLRHLRVVTFAHNYNKQNIFNSEIYNAAQVFCMPGTGIEDEEMDRLPERLVWSVDGKVFVADGYELEAVYDMTGRQVDACNLPQGAYVVRISDGIRMSHVKIVNKK